MIYDSGFEALTYEAVEGADYVTFNGNVMTILDSAMAKENVVINVKDSAGNVVKTFTYTLTLEASYQVKGNPLVGAQIEFVITSNLPAERFSLEIVEGGEAATLDGNFLTINEDAVAGTIVKVKVACAADESWGEVLEFVVGKQEVTEENILLAKGDAGKDAANIGYAALDLSEAEVDLQKLEKVLLDGEETTDYTISGNVITFNNPAAGTHAIVFETPSLKYIANVCFYGHSISTIAELDAWRTTQVLAYTVLLKDLNAQGQTLAVSDVWREGVLDGLGHTIYNFTMTSSFVCALNSTGAVKNLQLVNFIQDCTALAWENKMGVVCVENNGGLIENVLLKGELVNVPSGDHYGLISSTAGNNSVQRNIFAELTSDGSGNHYSGPWWKADNYTISNVAMLFNGRTYNPGYTEEQICYYSSMGDFASKVDLSKWAGWTLKDGMFYMSEYVVDGNYPEGDI